MGAPELEVTVQVSESKSGAAGRWRQWGWQGWPGASCPATALCVPAGDVATYTEVTLRDQSDDADGTAGAGHTGTAAHFPVPSVHHQHTEEMPGARCPERCEHDLGQLEALQKLS